MGDKISCGGVRIIRLVERRASPDVLDDDYFVSSRMW